MSHQLDDLFKNQAQVRILRSLVFCRDGLSLRFLAELSECGLQSTDRTVKDLIRKRIVRKVMKDQRGIFSLNVKGAAITLLRKVFQCEMEDSLEQRAAHYGKHPAQVFQFIESTYAFQKKFPKVP